MQQEYYKVDPGGNTTAIVKLEKTIPKKDRIDISKNILDKDSKIEQVGFWLPSDNDQCIARLEMMGGEFCGNAVRSLGYLLWWENIISNRAYISSSGIDKPIQIEVEQCKASIRFPLSKIRFENKQGLDQAMLPGTRYMVVKETLSDKEARKLIEKIQGGKQKVVGVMCVERQPFGISLVPYVWVRDTDTLFRETGCASGSITVAFLEMKKNEKKKMNVWQPSGAMYSLEIVGNEIKLTAEVRSITKTKKGMNNEDTQD